MGSPLHNNIRSGDWLMDYVTSRLEGVEGLTVCKNYLQMMFEKIKCLPSSLKPKFLCELIVKIYDQAVKQILELMTGVGQTQDPFVKQLAVAVVQMYGNVPSSRFKNFESSLCAGLPHFSTGYMRCWGRDTFISLKGLFVSTGLSKQARDSIFFFAKVSRHGLIPNLHDQGNNTRFNARDATWFFL